MSVNDFVVRAVALALAEVPEANAIWDAEAQEPKMIDSVDVAIAVATDKGLITPIVKAANTKSLAQVRHETCHLFLPAFLLYILLAARQVKAQQDKTRH